MTGGHLIFLPGYITSVWNGFKTLKSMKIQPKMGAEFWPTGFSLLEDHPKKIYPSKTVLSQLSYTP